jgi:UDP-N-acetylmuramate--alanine ligase
VINGGIINAYGTNTRMGEGEWMVVEADESDGSFLRLPATIAVVTNMDPEHLDHWGTAEAMVEGYHQFVENIPFYGFAVLCADHAGVQQMIPRLSDRRLVTYGFSPQADVRAERMVADKLGATFEVTIADRARGGRSGCRCWAATTCRTRWRRWRSRAKWRSTMPRCAARSPASAASSGASRAPARPAASW